MVCNKLNLPQPGLTDSSNSANSTLKIGDSSLSFTDSTDTVSVSPVSDSGKLVPLIESLLINLVLGSEKKTVLTV